MPSLDIKSIAEKMGLHDPGLCSLNPDQLEFIETWRRNEGLRALRSFSLVSCLTSVLAVFGAFTLASAKLLLPCLIISTLIGIGSVVTLILLQKNGPERFIVLKSHLVISNALAVIGLSILLHYILKQPQFSRSFMVIIGLIWVFMLWYVGKLGQLFGKHITTMKVLLMIPPIAVYYVDRGPNILALTLAYMLVDAYVLIFNYFFNLRSERHALLQLKSADLRLQNERLKIQAIESELTVAREMQRNLARPPESIRLGDKLITIYQAHATKLGGDWVAARELPNGRYAIAVGDGTGKGVPAAMVVQTVQALWTAGLSNPNWDPLQWLQSVNRTLRTLGRQTPHTLTLGLVVVDAAEIVYYSAGPMPLFMVGDTRIGESTKAFSGEGHLLGIYSDPQIKPVTLHLPEFKPYAVMLATDSIIPKRALSKDHRMYDLLTQVSRGGMGAIRSLSSDDDKILLLIQRAESLKQTA